MKKGDTGTVKFIVFRSVYSLPWGSEEALFFRERLLPGVAYDLQQPAFRTARLYFSGNQCVISYNNPNCTKLIIQNLF